MLDSTPCFGSCSTGNSDKQCDKCQTIPADTKRANDHINGPKPTTPKLKKDRPHSQQHLSPAEMRGYSPPTSSRPHSAIFTPTAREFQSPTPTPRFSVTYKNQHGLYTPPSSGTRSSGHALTQPSTPNTAIKSSKHDGIREPQTQVDSIPLSAAFVAEHVGLSPQAIEAEMRAYHAIMKTCQGLLSDLQLFLPNTATASDVSKELADEDNDAEETKKQDDTGLPHVVIYVEGDYSLRSLPIDKVRTFKDLKQTVKCVTDARFHPCEMMVVHNLDDPISAEKWLEYPKTDGTVFGVSFLDHVKCKVFGLPKSNAHLLVNFRRTEFLVDFRKEVHRLLCELLGPKNAPAEAENVGLRVVRDAVSCASRPRFNSLLQDYQCVMEVEAHGPCAETWLQVVWIDPPVSFKNVPGWFEMGVNVENSFESSFYRRMV